jgi:hypothetical protein
MECQICMETFEDKISKVGCGSSVDHMICFGCEEKWRSKMPVREGTRVMTCPTCRQPELERTKESLQRELNGFYPDPPTAEEIITSAALELLRSDFGNLLLFNMPRPPRPVPSPAQAQWVTPREQFCASGKDCQTRSVRYSRTKTMLVCRRCQMVACCKRCRTCISCTP